MKKEMIKVEGILEAYDMLQDKRSKNLFWMRNQYDIEPSMDILSKVVCESDVPYSYKTGWKDWKAIFKKARNGCEKIVLFGMGTTGEMYADLLFTAGMGGGIRSLRQRKVWNNL